MDVSLHVLSSVDRDDDCYRQLNPVFQDHVDLELQTSEDQAAERADKTPPSGVKPVEPADDHDCQLNSVIEDLVDSQMPTNGDQTAEWANDHDHMLKPVLKDKNVDREMPTNGNQRVERDHDSTHELISDFQEVVVDSETSKSSNRLFERADDYNRQLNPVFQGDQVDSKTPTSVDQPVARVDHYNHQINQVLEKDQVDSVPQTIEDQPVERAERREDAPSSASTDNSITSNRKAGGEHEVQLSRPSDHSHELNQVFECEPTESVTLTGGDQSVERTRETEEDPNATSTNYSTTSDRAGDIEDETQLSVRQIDICICTGIIALVLLLIIGVGLAVYFGSKMLNIKQIQ